MAQTNVMVSYAPARPSPSEGAVRERAPEQQRWSRALAGALLAGGAVFALGQFVTADGSRRETGFPMRPSVPSAEAEPVAPAPSPRVEATVAAQPKPLPYLALVRESARQPATPQPVRALPVAVDRGALPAPVSVPAATPVQPGEDGPALVADLAPQPLPPVPGGLRRDLEGFLEAQGHELVVPDAPGPLVALPGALPPAPALALAESLPEADRPLPAGTDSIDTVSGEPDTALALAEVREPPPPLAATPTPRHAEIEPPPATEPGGTSDRLARSEVVPRAAVIPTPRSDTAALSAETPIQSYPLAVVNGEPLGAITLRDGGVGAPAIHLGALLELVRLKMPEAEFIRLSGAAAADRFVSLDELRAAGIAVEFDQRENRLVIGAR